MPPIDVLDLPTVAHMYLIDQLVMPGGAVAPSPALSDRVAIHRGDITKLRVDAIVNAANEALCGGAGVDGAIHQAAGPGLVRESVSLAPCDIGDAKATGGYNLSCNVVIHTVGPVWGRYTEQECDQLLQSCYRKSLDLASANGCKSIAFPAISTGIFGYPLGLATHQALEAVRKWMESKGENGGGIERVVFCNFMPETMEMYRQVVPYYFPAIVGQDQGQAQQLVNLPDAPTNEPIEGDHRDAPPAKIQKTTGSGETSHGTGSSSAAHGGGTGKGDSSALGGVDDWVPVEKPPYSDVNGYMEDIDDRRSTSIGDRAMTLEQKEQTTAAFHTAQQGGESMQNFLERDW